MIGRSVGHYRIVRVLGQGGMGEVYEAEDAKLGRRVALKFLPKDLPSMSGRRERLEREARAVAALNHPSIVTIYSIEEIDEGPFLTMELVDGVTMGEHIASTRLSIHWLLATAIPLTDAIATAHQRGILHRDLKPGNVMVTPDGRVKVLDFGLAKLKEPLSPSDGLAVTTEEALTGEGKILGTVAYMSPEQAEGRPVDERSDIFSLGVMLYEAATGERPFKGETSISVITAILRDEPRTVTSLRPDLPPDLARIIKRAMSKDPEHRYQSARDLRHDLEDLKAIVDDHRRSPVRPPRRIAVGLSILTAVAVVAVLGAWLFRSGIAFRAQSEPFEHARIIRLTGDGNAGAAVAISRDGRYVAFVNGSRSERSLNLRQIATTALVQLVPPSPFVYTGTAFSPDGNFVYYSGYPPDQNVGTLYRVAVLGGLPQKLIDDIDSNVTFAPDGGRVAFLRNEPEDRTSHLVVAGADGAQPRLLAERKYPDQFLATLGAKLAWSPDGRLIAVPVLDGPGNAAVAIVDAQSGALTIPFPMRWVLVSAVEWLPDGRGLLVSARDAQSGPLNQIWNVPYPSGTLRQITNGLDSYNGVSLSADGRSFVSVAGTQEATLWLSPAGTDEKPGLKEVTTSPADRDGGGGIAWTPDNQVIMTSLASGNLDLWLLNPDTGVKRKLTFDSGPDSTPAVSPDGSLVAFVSTRGGQRRIWLMDSSGSNQRPISSAPVGVATAPSIQPLWSADGKMILFQRLASNNTWAVTLSGEQSRVTAMIVRAVARDGRIAGYIQVTQGSRSGWSIAIAAADGHEPFQELAVQRNNSNAPLTWSPDALAIDAVDPADQNVWRYPIGSGAATRLTNFSGGVIRALAWSVDGRRLAISHGTDRADVVLFTEDGTTR